LPIKESEINFKVTSKDRSDINENFIQRSTLFLVGEIHFWSWYFHPKEFSVQVHDALHERIWDNLWKNAQVFEETFRTWTYNFDLQRNWNRTQVNSCSLWPGTKGFLRFQVLQA